MTGSRGRARAYRVVALGLLAAAFAFGAQAQAAIIQVVVDTSSLSGTPAVLAWDLVDGDGVVNNTAVISGVATDGTLGTAEADGDVSGALPGPVTIGDGSFFNELRQGISLGDFVSFTLNLSTGSAGPVPDALSFFLLNATATASLVGSDLFADALLRFDFTSAGALEVAETASPPVPVTTTTPVPLPASLSLVVLGLLLGARLVK